MKPSLKPLLEPASIAIIGASDNPKRIGGIPLELLIRAGFERVYPVNPRYPVIQGLTGYPDIEAVPEVVDLAILAVNAENTLAQLERCHARGVKAAVLFASGFSEEATAQGQRRQAELAAFAERTGMPIAGPNCMGNAHLQSGIFTTFGTSFQPGDAPGAAALVTQSGNMCATIYRIARRFGVNFNHVINTGNEAGVELTDYLRFLADDPGTDSALCYVEGLRDGKAFLEAADAFREKGKLLALYKVGTSEKGAAATQSHTAALAGDRHAYEAAIQCVGAVRAGSLAELADVAYLHRFRTRQFGRRVAVLSVSGAAGAILADALSHAGAQLPTLSDAVQATLQAAIPGRSMVSNPVDLTGNLANDNDFLRNVLSKVAEAPNVDVLLVYLPGYFLTRALPQLAALAERTDKGVVVIDTFAQADRAAVEAAGLALFEDFDRAATAIAQYGRWREWRPKAAGTRRTPVKARWPSPSFKGAALSEVEGKAELVAFGMPVADGRLARSEGEARAIAEGLPGPLVVKLVSPDVQHKSEHGFVRLGVEGPDQAAAVYADMTLRASQMPGVRVEGVTVGPQLVGGVELLCGCTHDPVFGWMMTVGLGGVFTEVMADVSHRLLPVDATEAETMLRELKGFRLLAGFRGAQPADVAAAARAIASLSDAALQADARVREIEVNPLIVLPEGCGAFAADALVLLDQPAEQEQFEKVVA